MTRLVLFFCLFLSLAATAQNQMLIEAESFSHKGGWVLDQQFVEQMGSPYLLAHGLGIPVANAKTEFNVKSRANYHVFVRTKNWAPGPWEAPGKFCLLVNGKRLTNQLGLSNTWNWEYAGSVKIQKGASSIELCDLTGFEGRCDAIFFTTKKIPPPNNSDSLKAWSSSRDGKHASPDKIVRADLVITGGGLAGCAAAIAAASKGLNVALIHDRPVLGGNASSDVGVHNEGIPGKAVKIVDLIKNEKTYDKQELLIFDINRYNNVSEYKNISIYLEFRAFAVNVENNKIRSVDARQTSTGETVRFEAPLFTDCTGDGWIGYWAGADYRYGREENKMYNEAWEEHGDLWSPSTPDKRVMGSTLGWMSVRTDTVSPFPPVPWAMNVSKSNAAFHGNWWWEMSHDTLHQIDDAEFIRDHLFRAIYGSFYNFWKDTAQQKIQLQYVNHILGKRESRRLLGDYILTFDDIRKSVKFEDAIAEETRPVDLHYQISLIDSNQPDFYSWALFYHTPKYYVPYRSIYSRNIANLFMAGRCFSCTHAALGGPRVMFTTSQMGVATGYAAWLCTKYNCNPREIYTNHLQELLDTVEKGL